MIALGARKTIALELHVPIIDGAAAVYMKMRSNQKNVSRVCSIVPSIHLLLVLMLRSSRPASAKPSCNPRS